VAVGIGDALDVVGKIPWRQIMLASTNERTPNLKSMRMQTAASEGVTTSV